MTIVIEPDYKLVLLRRIRRGTRRPRWRPRIYSVKGNKMDELYCSSLRAFSWMFFAIGFVYSLGSDYGAAIWYVLVANWCQLELRRQNDPSEY